MHCLCGPIISPDYPRSMGTYSVAHYSPFPSRPPASPDNPIITKHDTRITKPLHLELVYMFALIRLSSERHTRQWTIKRGMDGSGTSSLLLSPLPASVHHGLPSPPLRVTPAGGGEGGEERREEKVTWRCLWLIDPISQGPSTQLEPLRLPGRSSQTYIHILRTRKHHHAYISVKVRTHTNSTHLHTPVDR